MIKILKRNGKKVDFNIEKIVGAIVSAMYETEEGIDVIEANEIARDIQDDLEEHGVQEVSVDGISDMVEEMLMESRKDVAKRFIIHRMSRDKTRTGRNSTKSVLSKEFISKYKHQQDPMEQLGSFVYYRTYSRWLEEEKRRERWYETVKRAVEYNCSIVPTPRLEAEKLFDNIYNLKQFLSGRTFWSGGTEAVKEHPMAGFNCSYIAIDSIDAITEMFYALMVGTGAGIGLNKEYVSKMAKFRTNVETINKGFTYTKAEDRQELTTFEVEDNMIEIIIGDSKHGWTEGLRTYLRVLTEMQFKDISLVILNYDNIRPYGAPLKKFGGRASGYESLQKMFDKVVKTVHNRDNKEHRARLNPIDALDICGSIAENVVVGGVRRSALISFMDINDEEMIKAKSDLYAQDVDGNWSVNEDISHRQLSNNSILFEEKPSREKLHWILEQQRFSGEPGFVNAEVARRRSPKFQGLNPCAEVLLQSRGVCNLTTINVMGFVVDGKLDIDGLLEAQRLSAKAGYRMTCLELEINSWDQVQNEERLTGCSLTGWQDMVNAVKIPKDIEADILRQLREAAKEANREIAKELGLEPSLHVTTVKPEGTLSQLPTVSSGVHYSHSPFFKRRVRVTSSDPILSVARDLGWNIYNEVGQGDEGHTKVVEFAVKAPEGKTKYDVSALEQLENYKMFQENYTDMNTSITVSVRAHEWDDVEEWLWNNWDTFVGISFLSLDDSFYELLPYEACTEEEYIELRDSMKEFNPALIGKYEKEMTEIEPDADPSCASGACGVR